MEEPYYIVLFCTEGGSEWRTYSIRYDADKAAQDYETVKNDSGIIGGKFRLIESEIIRSKG